MVAKSAGTIEFSAELVPKANTMSSQVREKNVLRWKTPLDAQVFQ